MNMTNVPSSVACVAGALCAADVARAIEPLRPENPPFIIAITGSVSVGKSAFATALAGALPDQVAIASTDGFLLPNDVLDRRGLTLRKGFPESFDSEALAVALARARQGPVVFPGYSHVTYDVDVGLGASIDRPGALIVEGLGLAPHRGALDALIYLDADETDLETWFVARFMRLWAGAELDPTSYYARFRVMDRAGAEAFARSVWSGINLPNLREHVAPQREHADLVVRKGPDHEIVEILQRHGQAARL
jgi:type I pantothenate kinase